MLNRLKNFFHTDYTIPFEDELINSMKSGDLDEFKQLIESKNINTSLLTRVLII